MKIFLYSGTCSESFTHKAIKQLIYKYITLYCKNIETSKLEKQISKRRADVYFKLHSGEELVVEIQNSYITVKDLIDRTLDYNKQGIFVLWILNGNGNAVATPKKPKRKRNTKISPVEHILHRIYGGRVYYVNIHRDYHKLTITPPYALHFSPSDSVSTDIIREKFEHYFIRNANYITIPSWDVLCVDYKFKIGRFYDKNAVNILKEKIDSFLKAKAKRRCENCRKKFKIIRRCSLDSGCDFSPYRNKKLLKLVLSNFNEQYGKSMIFNALHKLSVKKGLRIADTIVKKGYYKYY